MPNSGPKLPARIGERIGPLTSEQERLRHEIRAFLDSELPPSLEATFLGPEWGSDEEFEHARTFCRKLARRGWYVPEWPIQYGGLAAGLTEQLIIREELGYRRAPLVNINGIRMLGPILLRFGSPEQKAEHLPGIAACETMWCQGYSEPDSGSDLASLRTRAEKTKSGFVIRGVKTWTGHARHADWMFLLARFGEASDRHRGLGFFLVNMKAAGITAYPIESLAGVPIFAQEFIEEVEVPESALVGEVGSGWKIATALLTHERSNIARAAAVRRSFEDVLTLYLKTRDAAPTSCLPIRNRITDLFVRSTVASMLTYRMAHLQNQGGDPSLVSSVTKLAHTELEVALRNAAMQLDGASSVATLSKAPFTGTDHMWWGRNSNDPGLGLCMSMIHTVAGGSSEIQRNILAERVLGLPR